MALIGLRYDLRVPPGAAVTAAGQYQACLEQCRFGDEHGFDTVILSEHHGVDDGFLPAPVTMAAAVAGATHRIGINVAAVLLPLHDPVRLAEQLAVADLVSGGRVSIVAGTGYRDEEFAMAGITYAERNRLLEDHLAVLRRAWTGEEFEWDGRRIRVLPRPATPGGPMVLLGGSTPGAARRAVRLRCGFFPSESNPALTEAYYDEAAKVGFAEGFCSLPTRLGFVHVSNDPERDWARIAPHAAHEARTYGSWQRPGQASAVTVESVEDGDALRASGVYRVLSPDDAVALYEELGDFGTFLLHPLMGGMPPELAWESLALFVAEVLPRVRPAA